MINTQTDIATSAGIGLRTEHIHQILDNAIPLPWVELLVDNWLAEGGLTRRYLDLVAERYSLTLHGVGLSLGGVEPLDLDYLGKIKQVMQRSGAVWYSEHMCFSQLQSLFSHDLLPLPYTEEAIKHMADRIRQVQDFLECQMLVENVSSYLQYQHSVLSEGEFIAAVAEEADCALILDVNNFYVNQVNHDQDALTEIEKLNPERVKEIHLAGYENKGDYVIDAHNNPVSEAVWDLYQETLKHVGITATLIEWDNDIPELPVLLAEQQKAQGFLNLISGEKKCA